MLDGFEQHLGYKVAVSIVHQEIDPRISFLFVGPYITRLVRGIGILEVTNRMRVVGKVISMSLDTLRLMGMLNVFT